MDQLTDVLPYQRGADDDAPVLIHHHFGVSLIAVGDDLSAGDVAHVVLDGANAPAGLPGLCFGEPDGGGLGICEHHLRDGRMIGGSGESRPRLRRIIWLAWEPAFGASRDSVAAYARLVLAHVRQQD